MSRVTVSCQYCGKSFEKVKSQAKQYRKSFCCREHKYLWARANLINKLELSCSNCGVVFRRRHDAKIGRNTFCSRKCQYELHRGENSTFYKGGRYKNDKGYVLVLATDHPRKVAGQYVYEHVLKTEKHLGRYLEKNEHIHHINGIKDDNRLENLQIVTPQEHMKIHATKTKSELVGNHKSVAEMTTPTDEGSNK